jgi:hypothetical protein
LRAACLAVLAELSTHPISRPFAEYFDATPPSPDRLSPCSRRLGLNDIRCKLLDNEYATVSAWRDDIERIFSLSLAESPEDTILNLATAEMQVQFRKLSQHLSDDPGRDYSNKLCASQRKPDSIPEQTPSGEGEQTGG